MTAKIQQLKLPKELKRWEAEFYLIHTVLTTKLYEEIEKSFKNYDLLRFAKMDCGSIEYLEALCDYAAYNECGVQFPERLKMERDIADYKFNKGN